MTCSCERKPRDEPYEQRQHARRAAAPRRPARRRARALNDVVAFLEFVRELIERADLENAPTPRLAEVLTQLDHTAADLVDGVPDPRAVSGSCPSVARAAAAALLAHEVPHTLARCLDSPPVAAALISELARGQLDAAAEPLAGRRMPRWLVEIGVRIPGQKWNERWGARPHGTTQGSYWMHTSRPSCGCRCGWCRLARRTPPTELEDHPNGRHAPTGSARNQGVR